ncbi:MAG: ATP-dependent helicase, partial [Clostridia bacterium]|nr:ATP-dependent helicase [Clostridia bacterium]
IERLAGYARRYLSLEAFLNTVSLEQEYILKGLEAEQPERDVLTLSTIHSAKGKEWRAVFVIGLNQGRFPSSRGAEYLEEERRLFYVAVTRAKDFLYLVCSLEDIRGWESFIAGPSVFIEELPPSVYRLVELESM